ncbi:hypothetical protein GOODEAATRI_006235 [Goodea atripinnis]|uniref:HMG box domain-containing protein n=1 Tax=Goodea atripinnis TaxID=208336 RepID=A0ABV0N9D2_9TELE
MARRRHASQSSGGAVSPDRDTLPAISVLLGEQWKKMRSEERRVFTLQAKTLADEQKRLNPDCWKRKRTNSIPEQNNNVYWAPGNKLNTSCRGVWCLPIQNRTQNRSADDQVLASTFVHSEF